MIVETTADSAQTGSDGRSDDSRLADRNTHSFMVRSIGFEPVEEVVELAAHSPQQVSIALTTPAHVLNPIVVEAQRLQAGYARVGFDRRKREGVGQFLTANDIARRNAQAFSQLFTTILGVQEDHAPGGTNLRSGRGPGSCLVYVLDGHPFNRMVDGELNAMYQPDEIAGIEIYTAASVPSEFRVRTLPGAKRAPAYPRVARECTTVVVWTKTDLGVAAGDPSS